MKDILIPKIVCVHDAMRLLYARLVAHSLNKEIVLNCVSTNSRVAALIGAFVKIAWRVEWRAACPAMYNREEERRKDFQQSFVTTFRNKSSNKNLSQVRVVLLGVLWSWSWSESGVEGVVESSGTNIAFFESCFIACVTSVQLHAKSIIARFYYYHYSLTTNSVPYSIVDRVTPMIRWPFRILTGIRLAPSEFT